MQLTFKLLKKIICTNTYIYAYVCVERGREGEREKAREKKYMIKQTW